MFRLAHSAILNVFGNRAAVILSECGFELCRSHAGDFGEPVQRRIIGIVIVQIGVYDFYLPRILPGKARA
jgi:hypothetical protein